MKKTHQTELSHIITIELIQHILNKICERDEEEKPSYLELCGFFSLTKQSELFLQFLEKQELKDDFNKTENLQMCSIIFKNACENGMEEVALKILGLSKVIQDNLEDLSYDGEIMKNITKYKMEKLVRKLFDILETQDPDDISSPSEKFEAACMAGAEGLALSLFDDNLIDYLKQHPQEIRNLFSSACASNSEKIALLLNKHFSNDVFLSPTQKHSSDKDDEKLVKILSNIKEFRMFELTTQLMLSDKFKSLLEIDDNDYNSIFDMANGLGHSEMSLHYYDHVAAHISKNILEIFKAACDSGNELLALKILDDSFDHFISSIKNENDLEFLTSCYQNKMEMVLIKLLDNSLLHSKIEEICDEKFNLEEVFEMACENGMTKLANHYFHIFDSIDQNNQILLSACENKMEDIILRLLENESVFKNIPLDFITHCINNQLMRVVEQIRTKNNSAESLIDTVSNLQEINLGDEDEDIEKNMKHIFQITEYAIEKTFRNPNITEQLKVLKALAVHINHPEIMKNIAEYQQLCTLNYSENNNKFSRKLDIDQKKANDPNLAPSPSSLKRNL